MQELETTSVAILKKMSRGKRSFKTFLDYVNICSNSSKKYLTIFLKETVRVESIKRKEMK